MYTRRWYSPFVIFAQTKNTIGVKNAENEFRQKKHLRKKSKFDIIFNTVVVNQNLEREEKNV